VAKISHHKNSLDENLNLSKRVTFRFLIQILRKTVASLSLPYEILQVKRNQLKTKEENRDAEY